MTRAPHLACLLHFACLIVLLLPAQARADSVAALRADLSALTEAVAAIGQEISSGAAASQPGFDGSLIDRVERIRAELASLTGRVEATEFRIRRALDEASNRLGDLEFRLTELEGGDVTALAPPRPLGGDAAPVAPAPGMTDSAPVLAQGEQAAFDAARAQLDAGDAAGAIAGFTSFLETYPGSPFGLQATTLLAQAHRATGSESGAARAWLNLYLASPDGPDAAPALLRLGESLGTLGEVTEACVMFDELRARFPAAQEVSEAEGLRARFACPG